MMLGDIELFSLLFPGLSWLTSCLLSSVIFVFIHFLVLVLVFQLFLVLVSF